MRTFSAILFVAAAVLVAGPAANAQQREPSLEQAAAERLAEAERSWQEGNYTRCRDQVASAIAAASVKLVITPPLLAVTLAKLYALKALVEYTFRDEGYAESVDVALGRALEYDPYLDIGDPAELPAFVLGRWEKLRAAYVARFARSARPNAIGAFAAMVLEPTVFTNPAVLQPGISYTRNLGDRLALDAGFRFPLQWPPWDSIRGQLGILYFPAFSIERIATGVSFAYVFGLDRLATYTHSLSLGGRAEWLSRGGFGIAASAELLRVDLVIGSTDVTQPPRYTEIPFLGLVNVVFANITLYAYFAF